jgi:hypothetical protein
MQFLKNNSNKIMLLLALIILFGASFVLLKDTMDLTGFSTPQRFSFSSKKITKPELKLSTTPVSKNNMINKSLTQTDALIDSPYEKNDSNTELRISLPITYYSRTLQRLEFNNIHKNQEFAGSIALKMTNNNLNLYIIDNNNTAGEPRVVNLSESNFAFIDTYSGLDYSIELIDNDSNYGHLKIVSKEGPIRINLGKDDLDFPLWYGFENDRRVYRSQRLELDGKNSNSALVEFASRNIKDLSNLPAYFRDVFNDYNDNYYFSAQKFDEDKIYLKILNKGLINFNTLNEFNGISYEFKNTYFDLETREYLPNPIYFNDEDLVYKINFLEYTDTYTDLEIVYPDDQVEFKRVFDDNNTAILDKFIFEVPTSGKKYLFARKNSYNGFNHEVSAQDDQLYVSIPKNSLETIYPLRPKILHDENGDLKLDDMYTLEVGSSNVITFQGFPNKYKITNLSENEEFSNLLMESTEDELSEFIDPPSVEFLVSEELRFEYSNGNPNYHQQLDSYKVATLSVDENNVSHRVDKINLNYSSSCEVKVNYILASKRTGGFLGVVDVRNNQSGSLHTAQLDINENYASTSEDENLLIDLFVKVTKRNLEEEIDCMLRESTLDEYSMTQFETDFMENMYNTGQINDCESLERCVSDFRKS